MSTDKRLRIAIPTPSYPPTLGGLEVHVRNFAVALREIGCDVTVLAQMKTQPGTSPDVVEQSVDGLTIRRFPTGGSLGRLGYSPTLRHYLKEHNADFDVVHAFSFHAPVGLAVSTVVKRPFFFSPLFHPAGHSRLGDIGHLIYNPIAKRIFRKAEIVFCSTYAEREELLALYPFCAEWTKVVPITVDDNLFTDIEPYETTRPVILSAGRLDAYKRVDTIIEAMTELNGSAELVICGSGPDESRLRSMIDRLQLSHSVRWLGRVSDEELRRWQRTAAVAVSLSTHESFGLSLAEGAVAGAAVVGSDIPAHREMADAMGISARFVETSASSSDVANVLRDVLATLDQNAGITHVRRWVDVANDNAAFYEQALTSTSSR